MPAGIEAINLEQLQTNFAQTRCTSRTVLANNGLRLWLPE